MSAEAILYDAPGQSMGNAELVQAFTVCSVVTGRPLPDHPSINAGLHAALRQQLNTAAQCRHDILVAKALHSRASEGSASFVWTTNEEPSRRHTPAR